MSTKRPLNVTREFTLGITEAQAEAVEVAAQFIGSTISQYTRQALTEKLVREGFMPAPHQLTQAAE